MNINFEKIKIHNFLSLGDIELDLDNNNLVLIEGINNNSNDLAKSNGSGKSSIFNALCWALTGETIQGVSSNITNLYSDDGCFVTLTFKVDNDIFEITRIKDYKKSGSDLKIIKNGEDISGKGIRESSKILEDLLPDLTSELIGSIIILGQGLPHRFSNNTPSGRKEILEKLSKSDFMIEDLKERLNNRKEELNNYIQEKNNLIIQSNTKISMYEEAIKDSEFKLNELKENPISLNDIKALEDNINKLSMSIASLENEYNDLSPLVEETSNNLNILVSKKNEEINKVNNTWKVIDDLELEKVKTETELKSLEKELAKLKSITDICPTCGQKITSVHKPDTSSLEVDIDNKKLDLSNIYDLIHEKTQLKDKELEEINIKFDTEKKVLEDKLEGLSNKDREIKKALLSENTNKTHLENNLIRLKSDHENYDKTIKQLEDTVSLNLERKHLEEENIVYYNKEVENLSKHLDVINQMNTIVKRDFRGFLLLNVIRFIESRANEYSNIIFNDKLISFSLNNNNIDISYNNKPYENLSGGEKQKIDLIIQFALKDMLSQYLDVHCNILILDEIFDNLDVAGCQRVLNLISTLSDLNSIYIISHHSDELQISYDNKITIVKDDSGISKIAI